MEIAKPLVIFLSFATGVKKKKVHNFGFDTEIAEGVVDIDKLSSNMETEVDKLRHEFRNCITTRISPGI